MPKPKRKNRHRTKGGRPRKAGARYPSGKLKPPAPNDAVLAHRARLLGTYIDREGVERPRTDYQVATTPLDVALARGWITERQHKAAAAYAGAHRAAGLGGAGLGGSGIIENDPSLNIEVRTWAEMSSEEVAAIWDQVFNRTAPSEQQQRQQDALLRWKLLNSILTRAEQVEAHRVAVMEVWPAWLLARVEGRFDSADELSYLVLVRSLDKIARALRPAKADPSRPSAQPLRSPKPLKTKVSVLLERRIEVDASGEVVRVVERRGALRPR